MFAWLKSLFGSGDSQRGYTGSQSTQVVPIVVTVADEIRLADKPVSLAELRTSLQRYVGEDVVMYYQREHPERAASPVALQVVKAICDLGLAIAFPPEAKPTIDALMQQVQRPPEPG